MPRCKCTNVLFYGGVLALAAAAGSCQREPKWDLVPVEGTLSRAGQPLAGLQVIFWPDVRDGGQGPRSSGYSDASGHYELQTDAGERGAVVGSYRVCLRTPLSGKASLRGLSKNMQRKLLREGADKTTMVQVPQKYRFFEKTPLRVEVKAEGKQTFDFNVPEAESGRNQGRP